MGRGIEQRPVFLGDEDRDDFLRRVASLVEDGAWNIYAWALMPNHFHLFVRTLGQSLGRSMHALLTGYSGAFNRRHSRVGHLFQNRYKSIVCERIGYFREVVRYIHLNPVRASIVSDVRALDRYRYTGHAEILGRYSNGIVDTGSVLSAFGSDGESLVAYREFVAAGLSAEDPIARWVRERKAAEQAASDAGLIAGPAAPASTWSRRPRSELRIPIEAIIDFVCRAVGAPREALLAGRRLSICSRAREQIAYLWIVELGGRCDEAAQALHLSCESLYRAARRARGRTDFRDLRGILPNP